MVSDDDEDGNIHCAATYDDEAGTAFWAGILNCLVVTRWTIPLLNGVVRLRWVVPLSNGVVVSRFNGTIISSAVVPCFILMDLLEGAMRSIKDRFVDEWTTEWFRFGSLYFTGKTMVDKNSGSESL